MNVYDVMSKISFFMSFYKYVKWFFSLNPYEILTKKNEGIANI